MTTGELGIDLGGTKALAVFVEHRRVLARFERSTGPSTGPSDVVGLVTSLVDEMSARGHVTRAVGIGFPGLVDGVTGVVHESTILDGWAEVQLATEIGTAVGRPCQVDNDVNNAALAEQARRRDVGWSADDMLYVAAGTGIGGALVLGGEVWRGAGGFAGEIGHLPGAEPADRCSCGGHGCAHLSAGGRAIELRLGLASGELAAALAAGDQRAALALDEAAERLGWAISAALNLLDLPLVVIGGGLAEHPGYVEHVAESVGRTALAPIAARCRVERALAGYDAGAVGSAILAESAR